MSSAFLAVLSMEFGDRDVLNTLYTHCLMFNV